MPTEAPPSAPAVVAVVVTCDPGPWFEEVLSSLAAQDHPNLSVLVIDAGSTVDPTPTVAAAMPGAFVRRLDSRTPFGRAANEVLEIVEGASHLLFCHDDVALAPDAVRLLVEEAFRSNAGVASPKYVAWDHPDRLLAVGATTDKVGATRSLVDRGELDQEQHDAVREVLVAPSGATLVRADLFTALGGFDEVVAEDGEDLDLSWRARLAGARVIAVPAARVRHLEATDNDLRRAPRRPGRAARRSRAARSRSTVEADANRYRTVLTCYRWYTLAWVIPLAVFWALGEALTMVVQGRTADGADALRALARALSRPKQLRAARRRVQRQRRVGDGALRSLQVRGNSRLRVFLQSRVDDVRTARPGPARSRAVGLVGPDPDADGRAVAPPVAADPVARRRSLYTGLLLALVVVIVFGSRSLLGRGLPQIGQLPDTSIGWAGIWRSWWSTWQPGGLGVGAPSSPAMALLGLMATVLLGAVGTLSHLVVLGPLLVGPWGAYRAARTWRSRRGQVVAAVFYAVVPLPYDALARGHWDGLIAYAAVPWVLSALIRLSGAIPAPAGPAGVLAGRVAALGLLVAAAASVAPSLLYVVPLAGVALLIGSLVVGRPLAGGRLLAVSVTSTAVAFVLLLPWSAGVIASRAAVLGPDLGPAGRLGLGQVLRFDTGPFGTGGWQWLLLVAAALPLFVGRGWRLEWAARLWVTALVFFATAWAGRRGWVPALPLEVVLAPAAAALAGSAALGASAFELDLPGYRFGWRQALAALGGVSLVVASLPLLVASGGGRWDLPSADASSVLAFLPDSHGGDYRVLWAGHPDALPLAGRSLEPGFAYGTSFDGEPTLADAWATGSAGAAPNLASALRLVEERLTTKVGHLLGPAGVRYLVVPNHIGPSGSGGPAVPVPAALLSGLQLQTDLQALNVGDPNYTVYQNSAWAPVRAVLSPGAAAAVAMGGPAGLRAVQRADLASSRPVLTGARADGPVPAGGQVYVGSTRAGGWHLDVAGHAVAPTAAFGWAMAFAVPTTASSAPTVTARLAYSPPLLQRAGYVVEVVLWAAAVALVLADRRRRSATRGEEAVDPEWFAPSAPPAPRRRSRPAPAAATDAEEVWTDA